MDTQLKADKMHFGASGMFLVRTPLGNDLVLIVKSRRALDTT
jgi:hypothetical protein